MIRSLTVILSAAALSAVVFSPGTALAYSRVSIGNTFEAHDADAWKVYGSAGIDRNRGAAYEGVNNGWVSAVPYEQTWNALTYKLPYVEQGSTCKLSLRIATSAQLKYGEIDVRDSVGDDLAHVGPFGAWPAAPNSNGYNIVYVPEQQDSKQVVCLDGNPQCYETYGGEEYLVVGLWGDGSADSQWIRVDDVKWECDNNFGD